MVSRTEQEEKIYSELVALYDYAENLLDIVEKHAQDVDADLDIVEPLIEQLTESADILTEAYRHFVETGQQPDEAQKQAIENAMERLYVAMAVCKKQITA